MAIQLENTIMAEIGLSNHYHFYNGSGTCANLRTEAARKLPEVLKKYRQKGENVSEPDLRLCKLLTKIAQESESSPSSLTNTWQAASEIIARHITQAPLTPEERQKNYDGLAQYLQHRYLIRC
jgi:hypothetical protein